MRTFKPHSVENATVPGTSDVPSTGAMNEEDQSTTQPSRRDEKYSNGVIPDDDDCSNIGGSASMG